MRGYLYLYHVHGVYHVTIYYGVICGSIGAGFIHKVGISSRFDIYLQHGVEIRDLVQVMYD